MCCAPMSSLTYGGRGATVPPGKLPVGLMGEGRGPKPPCQVIASPFFFLREVSVISRQIVTSELLAGALV